MAHDLLRFSRIMTLIQLVSLSTVAAVAFTPAYPLLVEEFHLSDDQSQSMMTFFLLGSVFGRLLYGPLANAIGRKNSLYLGLGVTFIGVLITFFAQTYSILILGRWIQAIGAAAGVTITYIMIGDCHVGSKATKALSYVMIAFAIVPGIGTSISGYLTPYMGWRGAFAFLLVYVAILILFSFFLPETGNKKERESLHPIKILRQYAKGFRDFSLISHGLLMGLSTALLFIFSQEAPFISMRFLGLTPESYGIYYLVPAFGITFGCLLSGWLAGKVHAKKSIIAGIFCILVGVLFMGAFFSLHVYAGWALFLPQIIIQLGDALLYNNASSDALSEASNKANAATVILFLTGVCSAAGTYFVGAFVPKVPLAMPIVFLVLTTLMLGVWLLLEWRRRKPA